MTTAEIVEKLQQASADLLWMSESESPFEIVKWERGSDCTPETLISSSDRDADRAIGCTSLADFFAPALRVEDWYGAEELANVKKFEELYHAIESNLQQVQVFRVGEVEVTVYILGKTPDGDTVGLKAQVVET
jgi:hypothetical protein